MKSKFISQVTFFEWTITNIPGHSDVPFTLTLIFLPDIGCVRTKVSKGNRLTLLKEFRYTGQATREVADSFKYRIHVSDIIEACQSLIP